MTHLSAYHFSWLEPYWSAKRRASFPRSAEKRYNSLRSAAATPTVREDQSHQYYTHHLKPRRSPERYRGTCLTLKYRETLFTITREQSVYLSASRIVLKMSDVSLPRGVKSGEPYRQPYHVNEAFSGTPVSIGT